MAGDHSVRPSGGTATDEEAAADSGAEAPRHLLFGWQANAGAQAYYRIWQPLTALREHGYSTVWGAVLPAELRPDGGDAELKAHTTLIGQLITGPRTDWWLKLADQGMRLFYEIDDDVWNIDPANPSYDEWQRDGWLRDVERAMAVSRCVITTRRPLAERLREHTDTPIAIIPNYIPRWLLHHTPPLHPIVRNRLAPALRALETAQAEEDEDKRKHLLALAKGLREHHEKMRPIVVGWAGSSHHAMDWEHLAPRFAQWALRNDRVVVHAQGGVEHLAQVRHMLPVGRTTMTGWNPDVEEWLRSVCFDVAVLPLRKHVFNESKSPIATLVYAALGIPVVASDVGPYHDFVLHGETGFLFRRPGEMAQYLTELVNNPQLRAQMSINARTIAAAHTYERNAWKWAEILSR